MRLLGFVAAAGFVIATAMPASANCIPNKTAATFGVGFTPVYWSAPGGANESTLTGQFWQLGNRAAGNEGACNLAGVPTTCSGVDGPWLYFYGGKINMNAVLGSANVGGCPTGTLIATAQVNSADGKEAYFLAGTVAENSLASPDFNFTTVGDHNLVPIPRPRVTSSSRSSGQVTLHIQIPDASGGAFGPAAAGAITGYRLVSGNGTGTTDPGREPVTYPQVLGTFPGPQADVTQVIDCTGILLPNEKFVGLQVLFADGQASRVGATYRVGCDPAIATPKAPISPNPKKQGPGARQIQN